MQVVLWLTPIERPVVSEAAVRWVTGHLDSARYFAEAREAALVRAQLEVTFRLRDDSRRGPTRWLARRLREVDSRIPGP